MTTERRPAAKLAAPTINLASLVYGLDAYMRSRGPTRVTPCAAPVSSPAT